LLSSWLIYREIALSVNDNSRAARAKLSWRAAASKALSAAMFGVRIRGTAEGPVHVHKTRSGGNFKSLYGRLLNLKNAWVFLDGVKRRGQPSSGDFIIHHWRKLR
jgi:hypothetical protein